jgi:hypothetical protein
MLWNRVWGTASCLLAVQLLIDDGRFLSDGPLGGMGMHRNVTDIEGEWNMKFLGIAKQTAPAKS